LFVAVGIQQWGTFDPQTRNVHIHHEATPHDEDLLDVAAVQTFINSGTVYAITPDNMPGEHHVAAVFRYAV
jgi:hypothetical protein